MDSKNVPTGEPWRQLWHAARSVPAKLEFGDSIWLLWWEKTMKFFIEFFPWQYSLLSLEDFVLYHSDGTRAGQIQAQFGGLCGAHLLLRHYHRETAHVLERAATWNGFLLLLPNIWNFSAAIFQTKNRKTIVRSLSGHLQLSHVPNFPLKQGTVRVPKKVLFDTANSNCSRNFFRSKTDEDQYRKIHIHCVLSRLWLIDWWKTYRNRCGQVLQNIRRNRQFHF